MRYRYVYCVAPRAFSKSFICILAGYLRCMFLPNSKFFLCAPQKGQGADILKEKLNEIFEKFPLLKEEYLKYNASKDYSLIVFKNGSTFEVATALQSQRGERKHAGIIDEVRKIRGLRTRNFLNCGDNLNGQSATKLIFIDEKAQRLGFNPQIQANRKRKRRKAKIQSNLYSNVKPYGQELATLGKYYGPRWNSTERNRSSSSKR